MSTIIATVKMREEIKDEKKLQRNKLAPTLTLKIPKVMTQQGPEASGGREEFEGGWDWMFRTILYSSGKARIFYNIKKIAKYAQVYPVRQF